MQIGYKLATEAFAPKEILRQAVTAEQAGFDFVEMSDHYHPWLDVQGHAAFTWSLLGAVAVRTERIGLATGVTCPSFRYHPAIIAQAAATVAIVSEGRFTLGVGAGERLNEHVVGCEFPGCAGGTRSSGRRWRSSGCCGRAATAPTRASTCSWRTPGPSTYRTSRRCSLWPPAARHRRRSPPNSATACSPPSLARDRRVLPSRRRRRSPLRRGAGRLGAGCSASRAGGGVDTSRWALTGWKVMGELPNPVNFAAATTTVTAADVLGQFACGPEVARHLQVAQQFVDAGFDHLVLLNAGPDPDGFFDFFTTTLAGLLRALTPQT